MGAIRARLTIIDSDTGEQVEAGPRRRYGFQSGHVNVGIHEAIALSELDLSALEWRVMWRMISMCTDGGWTPLVAADLAKSVRSTRPSISRALKALVNAGVILKSEQKDGKNSRYRLNPAHFFKGSAVDHHAALVETNAYPVSVLGAARHLRIVPSAA